MAKASNKNERKEKPSGNYGKGGFKPVDYDASEIAPDADPGKYGIQISDVKVKPHKESGYPMLIIECEIKSSDDSDNEKFIGGTVSRFITIYPDNDRRGNFGKQVLQEVCDAVDVSVKLLPKRLEKMDHFKPLIEALKGKHTDGWVSHREYQGTTMTNLDFRDPEGSADPGYEEEEEEAEEPNEPVRPARAKKSARGRR